MEKIIIIVLILIPFHLSAKKPVVGVLPFQGSPENYAEKVWRSFYGEFFLKNSDDIEPSKLILENNMDTSEARSLGIDFLIRGRLVFLKALFLCVYSELIACGQVDVIDALIGRRVFSLTRRVKIRDGGVPVSIVSLYLAAFRSASFFRESKVEEVLYKLGRELASSIPGDVFKRTFVQVGAFSEKSRAEKVREAIRAKGFKVSLVKMGGLFKVIVGPITREGAKEVIRRFGGFVLR